MSPAPAPVRVAVVGGGIAGLAAAYELARARAAGAPIRIDLYEADDRTGGVIRSVRAGDHLLDAGPDSLVRFKPAALELCRELGIDPELIPSRRETAGLSIYSRGRLRPVPLGAGPLPDRARRFVAGGLLSWRGLARMAADLVIPRGRSRDDESLAEFFGRRLGSEAVERLIDPLLAGIHAGDPDRLSARATFPRYVEMEARDRSLAIAMWKRRRARGRVAPEGGSEESAAHERGSAESAFWSFPDGIERLTQALCAALEDVRVHLRSPVRRIGARGGGFELAIDSGGGVEADAVILAVPGHVAARLLRDLDPELAGSVEGIRYASSATVFLGYRLRDLAREPAGHGFLVPLVERRRINGATWASRKYPGRAPPDGTLARCYVGGDRTPDSLGLDDDELIELCRAELREMAGLDAEPAFTRVFRYERANPQYEVGHRARVAEIEARAGRRAGLFLTGAAYRGLGISDCVADGRAAGRRALEAVAKPAP